MNLKGGTDVKIPAGEAHLLPLSFARRNFAVEAIFLKDILRMLQLIRCCRAAVSCSVKCLSWLASNLHAAQTQSQPPLKKLMPRAMSPGA